ncbi:hypothetical protein PPERSA_12530 [Pseudocohnilembus persalinus]|uniref:Uncharacterized protein n=1 Tax=Pseudocohnilembus persalinus TaxID=266149 RepID=A0A0V0QB61_PSEPJ|nr:hypothetical protein PPERSA_12530 [Pseudocohnilembus persalinus]|eukprot:KRW99426.1 hypothetical protein PPERSA_12530 [Pseudocohnilembus persalinus]
MVYQFNYSDYKKEEFAEEVQQKYAFPSDKEHILRVMKGETQWSRQELMGYWDSASNDAIFSSLALSIGTFAFAFYLTPSGKVVRDRYIAAMTPTRRMFRALLPFAGLAFPIYLIRSRLDEGNGYAN